MSAHTEQRKLAAIMFTDMVGSTQLKQELGDRDALALIQQHHAKVRELLGQFEAGKEISTAGDSFLLVFGNPSDAVRFALLLQGRLRAWAQETGRPIADRIGIHVGEVFIEAGDDPATTKDLHGMQVDTCARVMALAQGNQILMTRFVFDNARQVLKGQDLEGVGPLAWLNHGPYLLKGVEEPLEVCEVGEAGQGTLKPPTNSEKARRHVTDESEPVLGWRPALDQLVPNSRWLLERKLGEGGFGEVWLGRHETLKERRVFKFCFRADRVRSLKREVTLFRLLKEKVGQHPNIVGIQEVFFNEPPYYIVMDYAEATDLRAWCEREGFANIPIETRLEIVAQMADALQAAHTAGVLHRDVKPGNILVSKRPPHPASGHPLPSDGRGAGGEGTVQAKLTDFGIGQVLSEEYLAGMTRAGFTETMLGSYSSATGTQLYMAPELVAGQPASARSDIYSLGVVFYQLLIGDFSKAVTIDWARRITDPLLREDLVKCFAGDPQERFAEAGELARNLRALSQRRADRARRNRAATRGQLVQRTTVVCALVTAVVLLALFAFKQGGGGGKELPPVKLAVLPLANLSGDTAREYFANEMTDDLIGKLGQVSGLRVIGRASVMKFKQATNSLAEIAQQLNVDAVVQGTLKREQNKVQLAIRLIQGPTDRLLWSTNYERDLRDVFALQDEVALAIASKLKVKLHPEEQMGLASARQVDPAALDLYYRGKALNGENDPNNREAIALLERAVGISKDFAPAWAALAGAYSQRHYWIEAPPDKPWKRKAQDAVLTAITLNPNLAAAWAQNGRLHWGPGNFDHEEALKLFDRALQLNPSAGEAFNWIAIIFTHTGFFDAAIAKRKEAAALNPLVSGVNPAFALLFKGDYQQSLLLWPKGDTNVFAPARGSHWAWALFADRQTNAAKFKLEEYLKQSPDLPGELTAMKAVLLAAEGDEAGSIALIKVAEKKTETSFGETHHTTYFIACAYARLNQPAEALKWLQQTADTGFPCYPLFDKDPNLDNLRADAGFIAFLKKQETDWLTRRDLWFKTGPSAAATATR